MMRLADLYEKDELADTPAAARSANQDGTI
jgi:hypothetical protein